MTFASQLLRDCADGRGQAQARFEKLIDGLSDAQANFKPAARKWSINECLDHVNISNRLYADKLDRALAKARARGKTGAEPYGRGTLLGRFILNNLRQASPRGVPAPGVFRPSASGLALGEVAAAFREQLARLEQAAVQADGLALGRIRFATPAAPVGRVTAAQAFEMMHLHTLRHLAQAERVKASPANPA
ncbi:MAG: DinB family protein [Planctomycetes bacterium]|nr:DinB family protein [Planctomycetota bacterium]